MSTASKPIGRPLGKGNLTDDVKIGILSQKKLQIFAQQTIADNFGVSRKTVNQMTEENLSPEGKASLQSFTEKLSDIREETSDLILEKLRNKTIKDGVLPTLLNIANQNYRLETNQSTANIATSHIAENINATLLTASKLHRADPSEPLPTPAEALELYRQACAKAGQECDETLIDLSVLNVEP